MQQCTMAASSNQVQLDENNPANYNTSLRRVDQPIQLNQICDDIVMLKQRHQPADLIARSAATTNQEFYNGQTEQANQQLQQQPDDYDNLGLRAYDYDEASLILNAQFDPSRSMSKLSIEEEEIILSHVGVPGLKYAKMSTIKHWMTNQTRKIMTELNMHE